MSRLFLIFSGFVFCVSCSQGPAGLDWNSSGDSSALNSSQSLDNPNEAQALLILQNNCSSCHGQASGPSNVDDLGDPGHMVAAGLIVPGSPSRSPLFQVVANGSMPPGAPLSSSDQLVLQNWIAGTAAVTPTPTPVPPAPIPSPSAPTFSSLKANIFSVSCNRCHSFSSYSNVMSYVSAGAASISRLYQAVNNGSMPKGSAKLSSAQIHAIYDWIQAGAKNN